VLAELHWLPVTARIEFKLALLTFKILTSHQPSYLRELFQTHRPSRQLRSSCSPFHEPELFLHSAASHIVLHVFGTVFRTQSPVIWTCTF